MKELSGKRIAVFAADIYEDMELWYPKLRFTEAGAKVTVIGPEKKTYKSKHGYPVEADLAIAEASASDFDALVIPGGYAPDHMRRSPKMVDFVRDMNKQGKPIAAICHGGWMLASAEIVQGKKVTCFFAIKDDLVHAGAVYEDAEVVCDGNLITSRVPSDLPAFCEALILALPREKATVK